MPCDAVEPIPDTPLHVDSVVPSAPPAEVEAPAVDSFASENGRAGVAEPKPSAPRPSRRKALARLGLSEDDASSCAPGHKARPTLRQRALRVLGLNSEEQLSHVRALVRMGLAEETRPEASSKAALACGRHGAASCPALPPQDLKAVSVLGYEMDQQNRHKALKRLGASEEELLVVRGSTDRTACILQYLS